MIVQELYPVFQSIASGDSANLQKNQAILRQAQAHPFFFQGVLQIAALSEAASFPAAVHATVFLRSNLNKLQIQVRIRYAQHIYECMLVSHLDLKIKRHLSIALQYLIYADYKQDIQTALKLRIQELAAKDICQPTCLLIQAMASSQLNHSHQSQNLKAFIRVLHSMLSKTTIERQQQIQLLLQTFRLLAFNVSQLRLYELILFLVCQSGLLQNLLQILINQRMVRAAFNSSGLGVSKLTCYSILNEMLRGIKEIRQGSSSQRSKLESLLIQIFQLTVSQVVSQLGMIPDVVLQFISKCYSISFLYAAVFNSAFQLVFQALIPRMVSSEEELSLIHSNPGEFISISNELTCVQQVGTGKVKVSKALQAVADNMHGFFFKIATFCVTNILNSFNDTPLPPQFQELRFNDLPKTSRIETCLMVLTVLSYSLSKREDITFQYEKMLRRIENKLLDRDCPQIIRLRFLLFYNFHTQNLFKGLSRNKFILYHLNQLTQPISECTRLAILSLLSNVFEDQLLVQQYTPILKQCLEVLTSLLGNQQNLDQPIEFYDLLRESVKLYIRRIEKPQLIKLVQQSVLHIMLLEQRLQSRKQCTLPITKLFHLLQEVTSCKEVAVELFNQITALISPLVNALNNIQRISFSTQALDLVNSLTTSAAVFHNNFLCVLSLAPRIIMCQDKQLGPLFPYFVNLVNLRRSVLQEHEQAVQLLLRSGLICAGQMTDYIQTMIEAILIIDLAIIQFPSKIEQSIIKQIFDLCHSHFQKKMFYDGQCHSKFNGLFLLAVSILPAALAQPQVVSQLNVFMEQSESFMDDFDCKLATVCLSQLLKKESEQELRLKIVVKIAKVLSRQESRPKGQMIQSLELQQNESSVYQKTMRKFRSSLSDLDQYSYFYNVFTQIRQDFTLALLSEQDLNNLGRVLRLRRVRVGSQTVPRKCLKVRK